MKHKGSTTSATGRWSTKAQKELASLNDAQLIEYKTETQRRIDVLERWLLPFDSVLPPHLKKYLEDNAEVLDLSKIQHTSRIRLQKYLFLRRAVFLLTKQKDAIEAQLQQNSTTA
jgi:hypothetical protein